MEHQNENYFGIYVFEGIDNVGKTTIVQRLKEKIGFLIFSIFSS